MKKIKKARMQMNKKKQKMKKKMIDFFKKK